MSGITKPNGALESHARGVSAVASRPDAVKHVNSMFDSAAPHVHKEGDDHDHHEESSNEPKYLMVEIKGEKTAGKFNWYASQIQFPYKRGTAQIKAAPVDDGHGHAH